MRKLALCIIAIGAFGGSSAYADTQAITITNRAHVPRWALLRVERAVEHQSAQVSRYWHTPLIRFGNGGWPLTLHHTSVWAHGAHYATVTRVGQWTCIDANDCVGGPDATLLRTPAIHVWISQPRDTETWSATFSHEIVESLVDPGLQDDEICDPVMDHGYRLDGQYVADFVLPSYFLTGSPPVDYLGALS